MSNERNRQLDREQRRRRTSRWSSMRNGARNRAVAASAILAVWGVSTIYDISSTQYSPPEGINTIALAAATYLFGSAFFKDKSRSDH